MKKSFNIFLITLILFLSICLTGCKKDNVETTGYGYGIVNGDYLGFVTLNVKNKLVTDAKFEEYFLPTYWAEVIGEVDDSLVVTIQSTYSEVTLAKYLQIDNRTFTLNDEGIYSSNDITNIKDWLSDNQENAKWYVENLAAGNVKILDANNNEVEINYKGKQDGFSKNETNYWPSSYNVGLGWAANMRALEEAVIGTKMNLDESKLTHNGENNTWIFGVTKTSATLVAAKDYYNVAKIAYADATK